MDTLRPVASMVGTKRPSRSGSNTWQRGSRRGEGDVAAAGNSCATCSETFSATPPSGRAPGRTVGALAPKSPWSRAGRQTARSGFLQGPQPGRRAHRVEGCDAVSLEHAKGRSLTPIQQGWDYANKTPESSWIIVSNTARRACTPRARGRPPTSCSGWKSRSETGFLRFVALLGRDAILGGPPAGPSPLAEILLASERTEREVTTKLYAEYREFVPPVRRASAAALERPVRRSPCLRANRPRSGALPRLRRRPSAPARRHDRTRL